MYAIGRLTGANMASKYIIGTIIAMKLWQPGSLCLLELKKSSISTPSPYVVQLLHCI